MPARRPRDLAGAGRRIAAQQQQLAAATVREGEPAGAGKQEELPAGGAGRGEAPVGATGRAWEKPGEKPRAAPSVGRWTAGRAGVQRGRRAGWAADGPAGIRRARSWAPRMPGDQPQSSISHRPARSAGCSARTPFRLSLGLCKLGEAPVGCCRGAFGHACDSGDGGRECSVRLAANLFKRLIWPTLGPDHAAARRWPAAEQHDARLSIDRYSEFTVPPARRLVLGKLACQAGFVISFYDLSRPVTGPPFSAARTNT